MQPFSLTTSGVRKALTCGAVFFIASCASTPSPNQSGAIQSDLSLCAGQVSNAPSTDRRGRVADFSPYISVNGVNIARVPLNACLSSGFGPRRGGAGRFHYGIDLFTGKPEPIVAAGRGVVESVGTQSGYGRTVIIRHANRVTTLYAHLSTYARGLNRGDRVGAGEIIGYTGKSGNATAVHLHYEISHKGRRRDPLGS